MMRCLLSSAFAGAGSTRPRRHKQKFAGTETRLILSAAVPAQCPSSGPLRKPHRSALEALFSFEVVDLPVHGLHGVALVQFQPIRIRGLALAKILQIRDLFV